VRVPREMVSRKSREVRAALEGWIPVLEMASVDEAYGDLSGTELLYGSDLREIALRIQRAVREETEITVSIGGGTNRLVAKLATSRAKPAGVHIVPPGGEEAFVASVPLGAIPGIGPAFLQSLERRGVRSIEDARRVGPETMRLWWGEARADWLHRRIRGISDTPVAAAEGRAKSISSETTFPRDVSGDDALEETLLHLVEDVGRSLRRKGLRARTVTVKLRSSDFQDRSRGRTLEEGLETDRALYGLARALLRELRSVRRGPVRLLGVALGNLGLAGAPQQLALLDGGPVMETERDRHLSRALDALRSRFGGGAIGPGRLVRPASSPPPDSDG
jgi:DNA polymerase IV